MLASLIGGFIVILVGVVLAPVVADQVSIAQTNTNGSTGGTINITGASSTIVGLTTLFFALSVAVIAMGVAVAGLKNAGVM